MGTDRSHVTDAPVQFGTLASFDRCQFLLARVARTDYVAIHDHDAVLADRSHRQFRLMRHAEFADDDDVERSIDRLGNACCHRDAAARQTEHDRTADYRLRHFHAQKCAGRTAVVKDVSVH